MQAIRMAHKKEGETWTVCRIKDLKKGDIFKLSHPDGTFVSEDGKDIWFATSDGYFEDNVWRIRAYVL